MGWLKQGRWLGVVLALAVGPGCRESGLSTPPDAGPSPADLARGRTPARVMPSYAGRWLLRPKRAEQESPERMIDALRILPGQTVADIGAGPGFHAWRLARRVGPTGRVYATEIQPEWLEQLMDHMRQRGMAERVVPVLGTHTTTGLPDRSVDLALMVDTYHELQQPEAYLEALAPALRPGGRLAIVEFRAEDENLPIDKAHRMTAEQLQKELERDGWRLIERHEMLSLQHLMVFAPPGAGAAPDAGR